MTSHQGQLIHLLALLALCVAVYLWLAGRNEAFYSECDCPPTCTEHQP